MDERTGTFVVTHVDAHSALLRDVETAQVVTVGDHPDLTDGELIEATVAPEPPTNVTWTIDDLTDRWTVEVSETDLEPTRKSRSLAAETPVGDVSTYERAGTGEVHVLSVPPEGVETAAADVCDDPETVTRAGRLDARRVEIRTDETDGVLCVRYLPE